MLVGQLLIFCLILCPVAFALVMLASHEGISSPGRAGPVRERWSRVDGPMLTGRYRRARNASDFEAGPSDELES